MLWANWIEPKPFYSTRTKFKSSKQAVLAQIFVPRLRKFYCDTWYVVYLYIASQILENRALVGEPLKWGP